MDSDFLPRVELLDFCDRRTADERQRGIRAFSLENKLCRSSILKLFSRVYELKMVLSETSSLEVAIQFALELAARTRCLRSVTLYMTDTSTHGSLVNILTPYRTYQPDIDNIRIILTSFSKSAVTMIAQDLMRLAISLTMQGYPLSLPAKQLELYYTGLSAFSNYVDGFLSRLGIPSASVKFCDDLFDAEERCLQYVTRLFVHERLPIEDIHYVDSEPLTFAVKKQYRKLVQLLLSLGVRATEEVVQQMFRARGAFDAESIRCALLGSLEVNPALVSSYADIFLHPQVFGQDGYHLLLNAIEAAREQLLPADIVKLASSALQHLNLVVLHSVTLLPGSGDLIPLVCHGEVLRRTMRALARCTTSDVLYTVAQLEEILGIERLWQGSNSAFLELVFSSTESYTRMLLVRRALSHGASKVVDYTGWNILHAFAGNPEYFTLENLNRLLELVEGSTALANYLDNAGSSPLLVLLHSLGSRSEYVPGLVHRISMLMSDEVLVEYGYRILQALLALGRDAYFDELLASISERSTAYYLLCKIAFASAASFSFFCLISSDSFRRFLELLPYNLDNIVVPAEGEADSSIPLLVFVCSWHFLYETPALYSLENIRALLSHFSDFSNISSDGRSLLHLAVAHAPPSFVAALLRGGLQDSLPDDKRLPVAHKHNGDTALVLACRYKTISHTIVHKLLSAVPTALEDAMPEHDPIEVANFSGNTNALRELLNFYISRGVHLPEWSAFLDSTGAMQREGGSEQTATVRRIRRRDGRRPAG